MQQPPLLTHDVCLLFFSCLQQTNLIPRTLQGSVFDHSNNTERNFTYKFMSLHSCYYIYLFHLLLLATSTQTVASEAPKPYANTIIYDRFCQLAKR